MFCRAMEIGLLGSRIAHALKEPYLLVKNVPVAHAASVVFFYLHSRDFPNFQASFAGF